MLLETYSDYLDTLRPYANDTSVKLTAPRAMMSKLTDIAFAKKTNRLDVIRLALAKFIHEESLQASPMGDPDVAVDFSPVSDRASI